MPSKKTIRKSTPKSITKSTKKTIKQSTTLRPFSEYRSEVDKVIRSSFKKESISTKSSKKESIRVKEDEYNKNITRKFNGDGKYIPKFKIVNSPSFASVVVSLEKGQSVYCNYGSMNYCDGTVDISTRSQGFFRSLIRKFFTTTSFFLNYYTGVYDKETHVSFSSYMPGDIIAIRIKKGDVYTMSSHGFLCATPNIKISTSARFRNLIVRNESVFFNEVSLMDDCQEDGMVWMSSYGGFDKVEVEAGESIKVNGGIFAFTESRNNFTLATEGNIKSFLFSGETILMRFRGPCTIYVHSQNFVEYTKYLKSLMRTIAINVNRHQQYSIE
jgi:uncharacterized protein (TIGR00266 family)